MYQYNQYQYPYIQPYSSPVQWNNNPIKSTDYNSFINSNGYTNTYNTNDYPFHITKVDNRPNSIKLPSISNFSNFKKPIVYKPMNYNNLKSNSSSSSSRSNSTNSTSSPSLRSSSISSSRTNSTNLKTKKEKTLKEKIAIETKIIEELQKEIATKALMDKPTTNSLNPYNDPLNQLYFKPPIKFLDKIEINDLFISNYVFKDPETLPFLDINATKSQQISLSKDKILDYKIYEFFYEVLKFIDKTDPEDQIGLINNFPRNQMYLSIKFDLNHIKPQLDSLTSNTNHIIINLKLLKTTNSKINISILKDELLEKFHKFMPRDSNIKFNYQTNRPIWRLGAKDELNILSMEIKHY